METAEHAKVSTIKLHVDTTKELKKLRDFARETYEDIIRRLIAVYELTQPQLKEEVLKECRRISLEMDRGESYTTEELFKRLEKHWAKEEASARMVKKGRKKPSKDS